MKTSLQKHGDGLKSDAMMKSVLRGKLRKGGTWRKAEEVAQC